MARGKGNQAIVSFRAGGSTFGTANACGAGHGFYADKFKISGGPKPIPDNRITGAYSAKIGTSGPRSATVSFEAPLTYQGFERVIGNFFGGINGSPTAVDTSAQQHVFKYADRDAVFGTFAYEGVKDTKVVEAPSVQFNKLTLSAKMGDKVMLSMEGMADDVVFDSAVNTTTTIDTVTVTADEQIPWQHLSFLMNDQTAGSLASAPIYLGGLELSLDRPLKENITTERGNKSSLFIPGGFATGKLKVDYNIVADGTGGNIAQITDMLASTAKKARIVLTSPTLIGAATQYSQHVIHLPNLRILPGDIVPVEGPDGIAFSLEFELAHIGTAPTGFTSGYVDGVVWEVFSLLASNPFSDT